MSHDDETTRGIGRRTVLRRAGALSAAILGTTGVGAAEEQSTLAFEADPTGVRGLESAVIRVETQGDRDRVRHEYSWDPRTVAELDTAPSASLRLELPEVGLIDRLTGLADVLDTETLARATAVVEEPSSPTVGSTLAELGGDASTQHGDWDLIPYAESTSPLCGTLAETNLRISRTRQSTADVAYDATELDTNTYDHTCEDEWYVPREFNTLWFEDSRSLDRQPRTVGASATYYNDDFPRSDRVWADHHFEITPTCHEVAYEHTGDRSRLLLEIKSETGYRN